MRISRLYLPESLKTGDTLAINNESAHYLRSVLRLKNGAKVHVYNGSGGQFSAQLMTVSRKSVILEIGQWHNKEVESSLIISLGLAITRGERMDIAVQKSVELGVTTITPLITERCVVQLNEERGEKRRKHWQKIAQGASEQSGRTTVPEIDKIITLEKWLANEPKGVQLFFDPHAKQSLKQMKPPSKSITILSGPEGGFSEHERNLAIQAAYQPVTLGPRILRAETACMAAITAIQVLWGDLT